MEAAVRVLDTTLREEANTDKKLTTLARSVINLRAKRMPKKNSRKDSSTGVIGAVKRLVTF